MSRKASISKEDIIEAAFRVVLREGFDNVSVRVVAAEAGCSTQPVFRIYENMGALKKDLYDKAASFYENYYREYLKTGEVPFVDLGMAYIGFARSYPHLFRLLFLSAHDEGTRSTFSLVNGPDEAVAKEVQRAGKDGAKDPNQLFMQMWIFIHGAATMAVTGDNDLDDAQCADLLKTCYKDFLRG